MSRQDLQERLAQAGFRLNDTELVPWDANGKTTKTKDFWVELVEVFGQLGDSETMICDDL